MTYDVAPVSRTAAGTDTGPTATGTAATLAAALAVIKAAHAGEVERLTDIHGAEIARLTEALTRSERRVDLLIARMDGLHDALMAVEAKSTAAEQAGRMLRQWPSGPWRTSRKPSSERAKLSSGRTMWSTG
jgi:hypothetical protein